MLSPILVAPLCITDLLVTYKTFSEMGVSIWQEYSFGLLVPIFILLFYVITRYRFLDIKFIIISTLTKILLLVITILSLFSVYYFIAIIGLNSHPLALHFILSTIGIYFYLKVENFLSSHLFYKFFGTTDLAYFRKVINQLKTSMSMTLEEFKYSMEEHFCKKLKIDFVEIIPLSKENKEKYKEIVRYLSENVSQENLVFVSSKIKFIKKEKKINNSFVKELMRMGEICMPLFNPSKKLLGFFVLGKKKFDNIYSREEIVALEGIKKFLSFQLMVILYNSKFQREVESKIKVLRESNRKLKKLDETKDDFLTMVLHEMRTPMTIIKGFSGLLLEKNLKNRNPEQLKYINYIKESTQDLLNLVHNMLDLSKIKADKFYFEYERVKIRKVLKFLLDGFTIQFQSKGIDFDYNISSELPRYIILDPQKLRLILNNILGNAFKFTGRNGKVLFKISKPKDCLKIEISDNGIGIAEEDLSHIFREFRQLENPMQKNHKGSGLGLAIVKKILDEIGGSIDIQSEPERGSTFVVNLPVTV